MLNYMTEMWRFRYFWGSLVRMDIRARYRGTWLGLGWSLLQPLAMAAVIGFAFSTLFDRDLKEFFPFLVGGLTLWHFITDSTTSGSRCLVAGEAFMRQVPAPVAIYPLRTTLTSAFHLCVGTVVVVLANLLLSGWERPSEILLAILAMPLLALFGWSTAVITGFAHAYFPDANHLIGISMRMVFYITPIMYTPDMMRERGVSWIVDYNPIAALISLYRMPLIGNGMPGLSTYLFASSLVLLLTGLALFLLNRLERKVIFQL